MGRLTVMPRAGFVFAWGLASLLLGCAQSVPLQAPPAEAVAVARFAVDIEGLEAAFPDPGGGLLPGLARLWQDARDVAEAARTLAHPESSATARTLDTLYAAFAGAAAHHFGLRVLPAETLCGAVRCFARTPLGQVRDVPTPGAHGGVLEVEVEVTVPDAAQASWSWMGTGRARVSGRPVLVLAVRLVNAAGQVQWRDRVQVRAQQPVGLTEAWLLSVRTARTVEAEPHTLADLLGMAVARLAAPGRHERAGAGRPGATRRQRSRGGRRRRRGS